MTQAHADKLFLALPDFSSSVYVWLIEDGLQAEPGFSDVVTKDIAEGLDVTVDQVKGALSHLHSVELTDTEDWRANGLRQEFIHAEHHANGWDLPAKLSRHWATKEVGQKRSDEAPIIHAAKPVEIPLAESQKTVAYFTDEIAFSVSRGKSIDSEIAFLQERVTKLGLEREGYRVKETRLRTEAHETHEDDFPRYVYPKPEPHKAPVYVKLPKVIAHVALIHYEKILEEVIEKNPDNEGTVRERAEVSLALNSLPKDGVAGIKFQ